MFAIFLSLLLIFQSSSQFVLAKAPVYQEQEIPSLLPTVKVGLQGLPEYPRLLELLYVSQQKRATDLGKRFLALYTEEPKAAGDFVDLLLMELRPSQRVSSSPTANIPKKKRSSSLLDNASLPFEPLIAAPALARIFERDPSRVLGSAPQSFPITYQARNPLAAGSSLRTRVSLTGSGLAEVLAPFRRAPDGVPVSSGFFDSLRMGAARVSSAVKAGAKIGWRVASKSLFYAAAGAALVLGGLLSGCAIPREQPPRQQDTGCRAGECHGFEVAGHPDLALGANPVSGNHQTHVTRAQCERCHDTYDNRHYDGSVQTEGLVFNGQQPGNWSEKNGTCSSTTCHGTGRWGEDSPQCSMCHGEEGPRGLPESGSHAPHLANVTNDCQTCHSNYQVTPSHRNGAFDTSGLVHFNSANPSGSFNETTSGCSSLSCHGTASWGDSNPSCAMCHGPGGILPNPTSGSHQIHVKQMSQDCQTCHNGYRTNSQHNNGTLNASGSVSFGSQNPYGSYSPQAQTCSNLNCHGTATWGETNPSCAMCHREGGPGPTPTTGSHQVHLTKASVDCGMCHSGYQTQPSHRNGAVDSTGLVHFNTLNESASYNEETSGCSSLNCHGNGTWGDSNPSCSMCHGQGGLLASPSSASHPIHLSKATADCQTCHSNYPSQATHRDGLPTSSGLVSFSSASPSGAFNEANSGCSSLSCHGSGTWGDTNPSCTMCHGSEGMQPSWDTGSHTKHVGELSYNCSDCHHEYPNSSNHRNSTLEAPSSVQFNSTNPSGSYVSDSQTCNSLYCHGPGPSQTPPRWGSSIACGDCHDVPPSSGSHPKHTHNDFSNTSDPQYNFSCTECHSDSGYGTSNHVNFQTDVELRTDNDALATGYGQNSGNLPSFNPSNGSCSSVYCHSSGVTKQRGGSYGEANIGSPPSGNLTYNIPTWGGSIQCGDCHAGKPLGQITSQNDYPDTGKHRFLSHMMDWLGWPGSQGSTQCFWCHGGATTQQGTYGGSQHANGELNFHPYRDDSGGTVWGSTGKSYQDGHCGNSCHNWYP